MCARRRSATQAHLGGVRGQPAGELAQHALDAHHRRGPQRQPRLGDVAGQRGRQPWRDRRPLRRPARPSGPGWPCGAAASSTPSVEQGGLRAEQRRAQRLGAVAVGSVAGIAAINASRPASMHRLGQLLGGQPGQRGDLRQRRPLQAGDDGVEPELGGGRDEPFVEPAVMPGGDLAEVGPARAPGSPGWAAAVRSRSASRPPAGPSAAVRTARASGNAAQPGDADPGQERARRRGHRVAGEHPGRDQVGPVGGDQLLDLGAMCAVSRLILGAASPAATACASIASAARRYSRSSQSLARCR